VLPDAPVPTQNAKKLYPDCEPLPAEALGARLCQIFSYAWNAIVAPNEAPTDATWTTITQYPLKPRVLWRLYQDPGYLVGVRFDVTTQYALIDIDCHSPYHPQQSANGIDQIRRALETIGICRTFCTRSSWSGGIHLWVPLDASVPSFWLATALKACLESHGLELAQGTLETFPNCKAYARPGEFSDYQGHRLPLQPASGAALLSGDLHVVAGGLADFFRQWDWAASRQDLGLLTEAIALAKTLRRHRRYRSGSAIATEWQHDLETEMGEGWTGYGQTNNLLKTVACYGVVFAAQGGEQLEQYVLDTIEKLPGYFQWCRHQHEIKARVHAWAKMAEGYYWALGTPSTREQTFQQVSQIAANNITTFGNGNQRRAAEARNRIQQAVETLTTAATLPTGVRDRMAALSLAAKCSNQTLNKHKALWHPDYSSTQKPGEDGNANRNGRVPSDVPLDPAVGSVCNNHRDGDCGQNGHVGPKQPDRSNPNQTGLLHTLPQLMKGVGLETSRLEKNQNSGSGASILPTIKNTAVTSPAPPVVPTAAPPIVQAPPKRQDTDRRHPNPAGLTGLNTLLPSALPLRPQGRALPPPAPLPPATPVPLPSDPPGECVPPDETTVNQSAATKPRRQPKPRIDPQTLPPNATYSAPRPPAPVITPAAVLETNAAIQRLLQQLQAQHQWTRAILHEWITQQFGGRRRSQLADAELPLLLEKLQRYYDQQPPVDG